MQCAAGDGENRAGLKEADWAGFEVDEQHWRSSWGRLRVLTEWEPERGSCLVTSLS